MAMLAFAIVIDVEFLAILTVSICFIFGLVRFGMVGGAVVALLFGGAVAAIYGGIKYAMSLSEKDLPWFMAACVSCAVMFALIHWLYRIDKREAAQRDQKSSGQVSASSVRRPQNKANNGGSVKRR